jgi:cytochrome c peroxidase
MNKKPQHVMRVLMKTTRLVLASIWLCFCGLDFQAPSAGTEDLRIRARRVFNPLPATMTTDANPITDQKIRLGKILFYETRISIDGTVSCARCHPLNQYAADGLKTSIGHHCTVNARNAPTVLNAAGQVSQHWIGNRIDVEDQARQSVVGPASFGMPSDAEVEDRLEKIEGYRSLFSAAFPGESKPVSVANLAKAIGAFERTLVTPSPFDAFLTGNESALTEEEKKGLAAFLDIGCASCHSGTYLGGGMYQKFGIFRPYWELTISEKPDEGRFVVTKNDKDRYAFKVPGLRNVARTPPYFHDGSVEELETAILIMGRLQLGQEISGDQVENTRAFLESLTGVIPEDVLRIPELPARAIGGSARR